ncbi:MAG: S41 family peptidase [Planctomycetaceae bacterium]|nr:S41 family peptidase [Planctomycetaceae bacterium]
MMSRRFHRALVGLVSLIAVSGSAWCEDAPVSAVWDSANGAAVAVERNTWLVDEVIEALAQHHVDGLNRAELTERWLQVTQRNDEVPVSPTATLSRVFQGLANAVLRPSVNDGPRSALETDNPPTVRLSLERLLQRTEPSSIDGAWMQFFDRVPGTPRLIPAAEARVQAQFAANAYVGLGVTAGNKDDVLVFPSILPGGSAERAGLPAGVKVLAIDGWSTLHQPVNEGVNRIRGPVGSWITLRIQDEKGERDLAIQRDFVRFVTVHGWNEQPPGPRRDNPSEAPAPSLPDGIAYLRCGQLGGSTVHELRQAELQVRRAGQQAVILDLRSPERAGDVKYAQLVADALLDEGVLWREVDRQGRATEIRSDRECLFRGLPLAVLISSYSQPSDLLLAAALRDAGRAVVIQEHRHVLANLGLPVVSNPLSNQSGQGIYRYQEVAVAEGRWMLRIPTVRIDRKEARWPVTGDSVWHTVHWQAPTTGLPNAIAPQQAALAKESKRLLAQNPALPVALQRLGPVGVAVQHLQQALSQKAAS